MSWRTVIVGLGQIGLQADLALPADTHVYSHARAFDRHPAYSLVAGVDPCPGNRALFTQHYDLPALQGVGPELAAFAPEVVVIAVPTMAHAAVLEKILEHCRPKAVLCEKPLSYDPATSLRMVQDCEIAGCEMYVNYIRRADVAATEIRQRLVDGRLAKPIKGVAWYSKGVFNNGSHFIDLLQYWLGSVQSHLLLQAGRRLGQDFEPDFLLRFTDGDVVFLAAQEEHYSHYTLELVARNGRLRYDLGGEQVWWQAAIDSPTAPGYVVLDPKPKPVHSDLSRIQWHVADQLSCALRGESTSLCNARQALALINTIHSICSPLQP